MFRTLVFFLTISLFASVGFSQEFYQPLTTYWAPYTYQAHSVQYTPAVDIVGTQIPAYSSYEVPTQTFGGIQNDVVQSNFSQGTVVQGQSTPLVSPDYGYDGPGDMRTHLWDHHASDLKSNGISQSQLNSMPMSTVQKWHNFFHGSEGRPQQ